MAGQWRGSSAGLRFPRSERRRRAAQGDDGRHSPSSPGGEVSRSGGYTVVARRTLRHASRTPHATCTRERREQGDGVPASPRRRPAACLRAGGRGACQLLSVKKPCSHRAGCHRVPALRIRNVVTGPGTHVPFPGHSPGEVPARPAHRGSSRRSAAPPSPRRGDGHRHRTRIPPLWQARNTRCRPRRTPARALPGSPIAHNPAP